MIQERPLSLSQDFKVWVEIESLAKLSVSRKQVNIILFQGFALDRKFILALHIKFSTCIKTMNNKQINPENYYTTEQFISKIQNLGGNIKIYDSV